MLCAHPENPLFWCAGFSVNLYPASDKTSRDGAAAVSRKNEQKDYR